MTKYHRSITISSEDIEEVELETADSLYNNID